MTTFTGICLITRDVARLSAFYGRLLDARVEGDDQFSVVHSSGGQLSFFAADGMETMAHGSMRGAGTGSMTLELRIPDVDATFQLLTAQDVPVVKEPTTQPWGRRSVWIRDPDGNIVNLYCPTSDTSSPSEVARAYFHRLFEERDLSVCDELLAPDYVDHDAPDGTQPGPAPTKAYVREMFQAYEELTVQVLSVTELGDHVALDILWDGVQGDGSRQRQSGLVVMRIDETGRIRERAATYTTLP